MTFEVIDSLFTVSLNSTVTLALAAILLLIGGAIRDRVPVLARFCIPAPVIGGTLFVVLNLILTLTGVMKFQFDVALQDVFIWPSSPPWVWAPPCGC